MRREQAEMVRDSQVWVAKDLYERLSLPLCVPIAYRIWFNQFILMAYQPLDLSQSFGVVSSNEEYAVPLSSPKLPPHQDELQDITFEPNNTTSTNSSRVRKHHPKWSTSTTATAVPSEKDGLQSGRKTRLSQSDSWTSEVLALLVGFAAVAAIIGVLARYNGRALPEWPYDITLNALIALLATVANATMSVSISSGLSQSKWIRFGQAERPLSDMEIFDDASRGSWGAVKLLATARGG
jgi:hypothetical protein